MNQRNKGMNSFLSSWIPKIISFILALLIFIAVKYMNMADRVITIPLSVTLPDESEIALAARRLGGCGLLSLQKYLVQYDTVNVFGIPIMSFYITVTFTVLLSVVLLLIAYMLCSGILKTGGKK